MTWQNQTAGLWMKRGSIIFTGIRKQEPKKAKQILRRLKFDNDTISMVGRMILYHDRRYEQCYDKGAYCAKGKRGMRRLMNQIGEDAMPFCSCCKKRIFWLKVIIPERKNWQSCPQR